MGRRGRKVQRTRWRADLPISVQPTSLAAPYWKLCSTKAELKLRTITWSKDDQVRWPEWTFSSLLDFVGVYKCAQGASQILKCPRIFRFAPSYLSMFSTDLTSRFIRMSQTPGNRPTI
mmetsp:Transcript_18049/g.30036  ORF Transcript_18049/g.30036 Transcript_18049/m.30036 type:complete len:118 (+) Transcript_18049:814-1167(+)